eukprot:SAG11_NODE_2191_length_3706_cov_2.096756_6_plen_66_part_00
MAVNLTVRRRDLCIVRVAGGPLIEPHFVLHRLKLDGNDHVFTMGMQVCTYKPNLSTLCIIAEILI